VKLSLEEAALEEAAISVRLVAKSSTAATLRLIVLSKSLVPHEPPLATVTLGASFTARTAVPTVAKLEAAPSFALKVKEWGPL
jgi:hypothetical protein